MSDADPPRLLVTGAGGQLGRRILMHLAVIGATGVVAASRKPDKLSLPAGFAARHIDFDDVASLAPAFAGIERALIISTDGIDEPGRRIRQHVAAVEAASKSGVRHLLYTSMLNPDHSLIPFAPDHLETEKAIARSGCDYSILRVSWYTDTLLGTVPEALASGKWLTSAGNGRINYVPRDDVARAAATALATRSGVREHLDITGPEPLTVAEIAAIAANVGACPIDVVQITDEQRAEAARAAGVLETLIPLIVATDANVRAGNFDVTSTVIQDLTGRPATSVGAYLTANKVMLKA